MTGRNSPVFFKQGPAPVTVLVFYSALSLALVILDKRFQHLESLRQAVGIVTQPIQALARLPGAAATGAARYFTDLVSLEEQLDSLRSERMAAASRLQYVADLEAENERLRRMMAMRERFPGLVSAASVLYATRDPFARRVVVDRGATHDVVVGAAVIDDVGVVGQVTRVFPLVSEVTLLTDRSQAVPVNVVRNGLRSIAFGLGNGQMELRFLPVNADVQVGDLLTTSGIDGVYHGGLPVARIDKIERDASYAFARVLCSPAAGVESGRDVLLLRPPPPAIARPPEVESRIAAETADKRPAKVRRASREQTPR